MDPAIQEEIDAVTEANEQARARNEELGEGVVEGKVVWFSVGDGKAPYEIVDVGETVSQVKHRTDLALDAYQSTAVDPDGNILTSILRRKLKGQRTLNKLFG